MLDNPLKYRVACFRKGRTVGVGIERYRVESDQAVIEFIGSYNIGDASRQETVRFYVREILNQHGTDKAVLIRIADHYLRNKREWLSIYPERVRFNIEPSGRFKTCQMMAADACIRGFSITENF
jgi:ABC-type Fe3+/spermidine/putrescine transport system ATPase subunit